MSCKGQTAKMFTRMGTEGLESKGDLILKEGQDKTSSHQRTCDKEANVQISQENLPEGDIAVTPQNAGSRKCQKISGFPQPSVPYSKAQQMLNFGRQYFNSVLADQDLRRPRNLSGNPFEKESESLSYITLYFYVRS